MATTDDQDHPHPWKKALWESRRAARQALHQIPDDVSPTQVLNAGEMQVLAHHYMLDYAAHLESRRQKLPDIWPDYYAAVKVPPQTGVVDLGTTDDHGQYDAVEAIKDLEWVVEPISLASLRLDWRENNQASVTIRVVDEYAGPQEETYQLTYHLPKRALSATLAQLDECLAKLNWVPSETTGDGVDTDEMGVLTHE